jgi:hypothetical protein
MPARRAQSTRKAYQKAVVSGIFRLRTPLEALDVTERDPGEKGGVRGRDGAHLQDTGASRHQGKLRAEPELLVGRSP